MIENARGVILRVRRLTESSLIVSWLTAESGRLSTVAKGALRPKSAFRGKLDLFYLAEFSFARSRRSELHTLREVRLLESLPLLRTELSALQQACYCAALIEQTTEADTPMPGVFDLMAGFLDSLRGTAGGEFTARPERVLAFELRLLDELGLQPDLAGSRLTPEARQGAELLGTIDWKVLPRTSLPRTAIGEIRRYLHGFLIYHFNRLARGREDAMSGA